ncbi:tetratricopeptide repeat protein [Paenibacillus sp. HW567]|uniref:tetratricopeptide repeat protein n=1 Tax=Paenibacillus sp. HW567 TaxID=1034769 RepID=UPI000369F5D3|nr:tetratricopeptide repeat protein [Paenibacillus sp. HW567]
MTRSMETAVALRSAGHAEEARSLLLQLLAEDQSNAELHYQLAWTHDVLGLEWEAVPYYERSLALGLPPEPRMGALLGLGSTYRTLGEYDQSRKVLEQGIREFPQNKEFAVFLAMTLHNLGEHSEAMKLLLTLLAETTSDEGIASYRKALLFYSDKLEQMWK